MWERNNAFRKPFSLQTVNKYYQRYVWQWWRNPMWNRPFQGHHLAHAPLSAATTSSFSRESPGWHLWSLSKVRPSEMSPLAAALAAGAAPHEPLTAAQPSQGCLSCAPKPCTSQGWTVIFKPCCQEGNFFWGNERITTQLLICHDPVLHWGDCWLELSYCALCGVDVIRARL